MHEMRRGEIFISKQMFERMPFRFVCGRIAKSMRATNWRRKNNLFSFLNRRDSFLYSRLHFKSFKQKNRIANECSGNDFDIRVFVLAGFYILLRWFWLRLQFASKQPNWFGRSRTWHVYSHKCGLFYIFWNIDAKIYSIK